MKNKYLQIVITSLFISMILFINDSSSGIDKNKTGKIRLRKPDIVDLVYVKYNNWNYVMRNQGSYMYDSPDLDHNGNNAGGEFPRGSGITIVYSGGLYIGKFKNGIPVVSESEYSTEFQPGRIWNSDVSFDSLKSEDPLSTLQQVYLIDRSRRGDDYQNWPSDALRDSKGLPALVADAQTWAVFNDLNTSLNSESQAESPYPGLGMQVALESFVSKGPYLTDAVYLKWTIENRSNSDYANSYIGLWMDADVGWNSGNDLVGVDTTRSLGFTYNNTSDDNPDHLERAVGVDLLQGPVVHWADIPAKDAEKFRNNTTRLVYDKNEGNYVRHDLDVTSITLGPTSFSTYAGGTDPINNEERLNLLRGANKTTGVMRFGCGYNDYFAFRGNPLTEQGTCDVAGINNPRGGIYATAADQRQLLGVGPFTFKAGESKEIWAAVIGGIGTDRLDAVRNLFRTDDVVQQVFDKGLFPAQQYPVVPQADVTSLDGKVVITWKNNAETAEDLSGELLQINKSNGYSADYVKNDFQGYRVYRSLTGLDSSFELLAQYDKVDTIGSIVNRTLNANGILEISEIHLGDNTGLRYSYTDEGLTNGQNYFYSVTAYDAQPYIGGPDSMLFDGHYIPKPLGLSVSLESPITSNVFSAVPNAPIASVKFDAAVSSATHTSGASDGYIAVEIVDPEKVTGHTYRIEFSYMPVTISGDTLAGVTPSQTIYKVFDVTANAYMQFSSRTDDPRTFLDRNNDGIFNGADSVIDERYYGTRIALFDANLSDEDFAIGDGLLWKIYRSTSFFITVSYSPGTQYSTASVTPWWRGHWGNNFADQEYGNLGIGSPVNGMTPYYYTNYGGPVMGSGGDKYNRNVRIEFSRDSTKWQYIYSTTGGSDSNRRYLRVPFRIFETDPTDGNAVPRQLNARTRDRNTAGGNSQAWGLFTGGTSGPNMINDGLGPQTRGFIFLDTTSYDLGSKTGHYGILDGTEKLFSAVNYFSSPSYLVWTPAPQSIYDLPAGLLDGNTWNLLCRSVIGNATEFNQGQQGYVYRQIPDEGTIQTIVNHPFTNLDTYIFTTTANSQLSKAEQKKNMKDIKAVPNPFYKYSSFETSFDKLIKFTNLPSSCTIKIFTVAGDLVRTLKHNASSDNDRVNTNPYDKNFEPAEDATSIERWDLRTANGHYVASGMYIALVKSSAGKKLVKFAVIQ